MKTMLLSACLIITPGVSADDGLDAALDDEAFLEFLGSFDEADEALFDPLWLDDDTLSDVTEPAAEAATEKEEENEL